MKLSVAIFAAMFMIGCGREAVMQPVEPSQLTHPQPVESGNDLQLGCHLCACQCDEEEKWNPKTETPCWDAAKDGASRAADAATDAAGRAYDAGKEYLHEATAPDAE